MFLLDAISPMDWEEKTFNENYIHLYLGIALRISAGYVLKKSVTTS